MRTRFSFARENADLRNFSYRRSCIGVKPAVTSSPDLRRTTARPPVSHASAQGAVVGQVGCAVRRDGAVRHRAINEQLDLCAVARQGRRVRIQRQPFGLLRVRGLGLAPRPLRPLRRLLALLAERQRQLRRLGLLALLAHPCERTAGLRHSRAPKIQMNPAGHCILTVAYSHTARKTSTAGLARGLRHVSGAC